MTNERIEERERETSDSRTALRAVLPLAIDVIAPIAVYYVLHALGVDSVIALAVGGVIPVARIVWNLRRTGKTDPLAVFVLIVILVSIPVGFIAGSPRLLLAKDTFGAFPMGLWIVISALRSNPVLASSTRALLAHRGAKSVAWDALMADSAPFRAAVNNVSMVWGVGFLVQAAIRLILIYTVPVDVAVWATVVPLALMLVTCIVVQQRWLNAARRMIAARVTAAVG
jgi:hypothetical protein